MTEDPTTSVQLLARAYELFDAGDLDRLGEVYADDVEMITPDERLEGIEGVVGLFRDLRAAFPDIAHELRGSIQQGNRAATEWIVSGTHLGPLSTPDGEIPPTGARFELPMAEFVHVGRGRIRRSVSYWDNALFASQLGLDGDLSE